MRSLAKKGLKRCAEVKDLRPGLILNHPGGPNRIPSLLISERGKQQGHRSEHVMLQALKTRGWSQPRNAGKGPFPEAEKGNRL